MKAIFGFIAAFFFVYSTHAIVFSQKDIKEIIAKKRDVSLEVFLLAHLYELTIINNIRTWDQFKDDVQGHKEKIAFETTVIKNKYDTIFMLEKWISLLNEYPLLKITFLNGISANEILYHAQVIYSGYDRWFSYSRE